MRYTQLSVISLLILAQGHVSAQKIFTKNGSATFFSRSAVENITAENHGVVSVLDRSAGDLQFSVLMKGFHFSKSLMEEHFNENYVESDKYPKAVFRGKIAEPASIDFAKDGDYPVTVTGSLTMHGVTKAVTEKGTIRVKQGVVSALSTFSLALADYGISIPAVVRNNVSKTVEVTIDCSYDQKM